MEFKSLFGPSSNEREMLELLMYVVVYNYICQLCLPDVVANYNYICQLFWSNNEKQLLWSDHYKFQILLYL